MAYYTNNRSPPPLQHPVPTHPAYIPEPPSTPASPQGYQRFTSTPPPQNYAPGVAPGSGSRIPTGYASHASQYQPAAGTSPRQQQPIHGQIPPQMNPVAPVDFSAWGLNDATAQFGMQLGQSAVAAGQEYVQKNVSYSITRQCYYPLIYVSILHPEVGWPSSNNRSQAPFRCL